MPTYPTPTIALSFMTDYFRADERRMLFNRIEKLKPSLRSDSDRVSGHQVIVHLCSSLREILGLQPAAKQGTILHRTLLKWLVFHLTPWPELEPRTEAAMRTYLGPREPRTFEEDHAEFVALLQAFDVAVRDGTIGSHPVFGALSRDEWGQYMFLHFDYHLTTFGIHGDFRDRRKPETHNASA